MLVCCGLLAKWLRVRVRIRIRIRIRVGERGMHYSCTFFPSGLISVVNTFVFVGSVSMRQVTYGIMSRG